MDDKTHNMISDFREIENNSDQFEKQALLPICSIKVENDNLYNDSKTSLQDQNTVDIKQENFVGIFEKEQEKSNENIHQNTKINLIEIKQEDFNDEQCQINDTDPLAVEGSNIDFVKLQCKHCEKAYKYTSSLKTHEEKCEMKNNTKYFSIRNQKNHKIIEAFKCETCDKAFTEKQSLKFHIENCSHESKYKCPCCGKKFSILENLNEHFESHMTPKCDKCGKEFSDLQNLNKHICINNMEATTLQKSSSTINEKKRLHEAQDDSKKPKVKLVKLTFGGEIANSTSTSELCGYCSGCLNQYDCGMCKFCQDKNSKQDCFYRWCDMKLQKSPSASSGLNEKKCGYCSGCRNQYDCGTCKFCQNKNSKQECFYRWCDIKLQKTPSEFKNIHETPELKCNYCKGLFSKEELKIHISAMHKCKVCLIYFKETKDLKIHVFNGHKTPTNSELNENKELNEKLFVSKESREFERYLRNLRGDQNSIQNSIPKSIPNSTIKCDKCGDFFSNLTFLKRHVCQMKQIKCYHCEKILAIKDLNSHIKEIHVKPLQLEYFERKNSSIPVPESQLEKLTEQQKCNYCEIILSKKDLENHISSKHTCNYCLKYFEYFIVKDLKSHIKVMHGTEDFKSSRYPIKQMYCYYCEDFFSLWDIKNHIRLIHGTIVFPRRKKKLSKLISEIKHHNVIAENELKSHSSAVHTPLN